MRRLLLAALMFAVSLPAMVLPAMAQTPVKIGTGFGVGFLPMFIADELKLVEKHGKAAGLNLTASYIRFSGSSAMQDAVLSGSVDMGVYGVAAMLIAWDKARGTGSQVFGIAGVNSTPLILVTNQPAVKDITELTPTDRIAMPALISPQMYALQMLAEKRFGAANYDHFRTQVAALPHPESVNALLSGGTEVKAYFSTPPFTQILLDSGRVHAIASSNDAFGGRATFLALGATKRYLDANPAMAAVMVAALQEAGDIIRADPKRAAEIYLKVEPSKYLDQARVETMLKAQHDDFGIEVSGVKQLADFMGRIGGLRRVPASYSEVFLPVLKDTPSN